MIRRGYSQKQGRNYLNHKYIRCFIARGIMNAKEFASRYNLKLNDQQLEAVGTVEGPCLLLAVPGSGKTTVLVTRLGYMIYECGISPENILTLTYTKSATKDMAERYHSIFKDQIAKEIRFSTINSISYAILNKFCIDNGKECFDLEQDEGVRTKRISKIYRDIMNDYPTESDIKDITGNITYIKNMMLSDKDIENMDKKVGYPISKMYGAYKQSMRNDKVIDFDDQMVYAHMILANYPEVLAFYQNKYKYICVDEAQDTSKIQHMIINLLAGENGNLFMVGDEDQSIYGFRAAYPEALLDFDKYHPGGKILLMEENFRSNSSIVDAAQIFIQKNTLRHKKTIKAHRDKGTDIKQIKISDRSEQYDYIIRAVKDSDEEVAVLYRYNECVVPLVDMLDREKIPFRIKGDDLTFFTHRVVQDITDIIKLIINDKDYESFLKIYYKLNLYLSKQDANSIVYLAKKGSIIDAILNNSFGDNDKNTRLKEFARRMKRLKNSNPVQILDSIASTMGYRAYLQKHNMGTAELSILKYIFRYAISAESALKRLETLRKIIKEDSNTDSNVILSTIHNSKGLEYKTVYILDAIDGIFPVETHEKLFHDKVDLAEYEEERRIFYVAITRAKDNLVVFKHKNGSTFVDEMKPVKNVIKKNEFNTGRISIGNSRPVKITSNRYSNNLKKVDVNAVKELLDELVEGRVVRHIKYGKGVVTAVKPPYVDIDFSGVKKTLSINLIATNKSLKPL